MRSVNRTMYGESFFFSRGGFLFSNNEGFPQGMVGKMLAMLAKSKDASLQSVGMRLDFNGHYQL